MAAAHGRQHFEMHLFFKLIDPWEFGYDYKNVILSLVLQTGIFRTYDNVIRWMPQDVTDDKSTLVQVMAWCRQATSHYLNQCWPRFMLPYGITRPQWVKDHDDVMTWKCFPHYWPFLRHIHWSPVVSPHKRPWRSKLWCFLHCTLEKLLNKQSIRWWS